jgi:hypothetical protein
LAIFPCEHAESRSGVMKICRKKIYKARKTRRITTLKNNH